mmetsp:Transcript_83788/g.167794  ORF Transcript_83788/g.167794 Transcript_83788/m.167794 type:complete len:204 (-) Transcript_83788:333-944(-)
MVSVSPVGGARPGPPTNRRSSGSHARKTVSAVRRTSGAKTLTHESLPAGLLLPFFIGRRRLASARRTVQTQSAASQVSVSARVSGRRGPRVLLRPKQPTCTTSKVESTFNPSCRTQQLEARRHDAADARSHHRGIATLSVSPLSATSTPPATLAVVFPPLAVRGTYRLSLVRVPPTSTISAGNPAASRSAVNVLSCSGRSSFV